jgi:hypothetical protein
VLAYDVPWPVSLLLGPQQLSAYADIFSVLLRLRRLQQQLCRQWQPLNSRPGSTSSRRPGMAAAGAGSGSSRRRAMWQQAAPEQQQQQATAEEEGGEQRRLQVLGLSRLQTLRQWHALALASIESLLGHMSGELCGGLLARFQDAIASQPVSLPVMADRHARLLAAARQLCLLPPVAPASGPVSSGSAVGGLAAGVYQLVQCGWALQATVDQLLLALHEQQKATGSGERSKHVRAAGRSGFREGGAARGLAALLAAGDDDDDAELWGALADAGEGLEGTLALLKRHLRKSSASCGTLSGLAARLGVVQVVD